MSINIFEDVKIVARGIGAGLATYYIGNKIVESCKIQNKNKDTFINTASSIAAFACMVFYTIRLQRDLLNR